MSKVRILSPRPENSTRRIRGGFNFLAFAAVLIFCLERADSNDKQSFVGVRIFHSVAMRPACILVVVQTSHCSFSHTRIPSVYACGYPRSCSNFALLVFTYSDSPRLKFVDSAENAGFYIQKCTVCDFQNAKSAQISDITFYDSQFEM